MSQFISNDKYYITDPLVVMVAKGLHGINKPEHKHGFIEFVYMLKGECVHIIDGKEYRVNHGDTIEVQVEMTPEMFSDSLSEVSAREKALVNALKGMLGIYAKVTLVAPKTITRSEGKAVRIIDKRKLY